VFTVVLKVFVSENYGRNGAGFDEREGWIVGHGKIKGGDGLAEVLGFVVDGAPVAQLDGRNLQGRK